MDIIYWNINNNIEAFNLLIKSHYSNDNVLISFSEYWEIFEKIDTNNGKYIWIDDIGKRIGFSYLKSKVTTIRNYKYYCKIGIELNDIIINIILVHLKSLVGSEITSESINRYQSQEIMKELKFEKSKNSIIIGDFNLPFTSNIMYDFFMFNATSYFNSGLDKTKVFDGNERMKYYNPMLSYFGDLTNSPPGTYYCNEASRSQSWHIFDNALISYDLAERVNKNKCEIITCIDGISLLNDKGLPNKKYSDHLPIIISIE